MDRFAQGFEWPSDRMAPSPITMTRVQRASMSSISCVVKMTVVPCCALSSLINARTASLETASSPIVGSSRKRSLGLCRRDAASIASHALAERQLAHGSVEKAAQIELFDQLGGALCMRPERLRKWNAAVQTIQQRANPTKAACVDQIPRRYAARAQRAQTRVPGQVRYRSRSRERVCPTAF